MIEKSRRVIPAETPDLPKRFSFDLLLGKEGSVVSREDKGASPFILH